MAARLAVYDAGLGDVSGAAVHRMACRRYVRELARRMEGYHLRTFYVHNTYLALLVEFGVPGLAI